MTVLTAFRREMLHAVQGQFFLDFADGVSCCLNLSPEKK